MEIDLEIDGLLDDGDSPEEREMLRQAYIAIELWVRKRHAEGATMDDLRREMEAMCDVADLQVLTGVKLGKA